MPSFYRSWLHFWVFSCDPFFSHLLYFLMFYIIVYIFKEVSIFFSLIMKVLLYIENGYKEKWSFGPPTPKMLFIRKETLSGLYNGNWIVLTNIDKLKLKYKHIFFFLFFVFFGNPENNVIAIAKFHRNHYTECGD